MIKNLSSKRRLMVSASLAIATGIMGFSLPAHALFGGGGFSGIVFDPTNYAKNTITALQQQIDTTNGYIQMAQDIKQTTRKLSDIAANDLGLNSVEGQALMKFIQTGRNLQGSLRNTQQVNENMHRVFAASQYTSWEDFLGNIGQRKAQGDMQAKTLYDSAYFAEEQLRKSHEQHQKVVNEMPRIEGVTDAAIATAQSVGLVVQQNQAVIQMMAASSRIQGEELQRQALQREQEELARKEYFDKAKAALARDKAVMGIR